MLLAREEIQLPQPFVNIVTSVYRGSFLQVLSGQQLTEPVALNVGIKSGCREWIKWINLCPPQGVPNMEPARTHIATRLAHLPGGPTRC